MLRLLHYSVLIFLVLAQNAFAQGTVGVRTGEHDEYSRLVFDWASDVDYTIDTSQSGTLVIEFENSASLSAQPAATNTARNISTFEVLQEDPLRVSLGFPAEARTRDFKAGTRVVIDVYATEGGAAVAVPPPEVSEAEPLDEPPSEEDIAALEEPEVETQSEEDLAEAPAEEPELAAEDIQAPDQDDLAALTEEDFTEIGDEETAEEETAGEELEEETPFEERALQQAKVKKTSSTVVSLSSTRSQGLASFVLNDELWILNDQPDLLLSPQVTGPDRGALSPLETIDIEGGKAFKTKPGVGKLFVRGQGGGLVWRVILSHTKPNVKPVKPIREGVVEGKDRSGKIIWPLPEAARVLEVEDPVSGLVVKVIPVKSSKNFAGEAYDFVDFRTLPSPVGLAIIPKVDDLEIEFTDRGVEISRPGGLSLQTEDRISSVMAALKQSTRGMAANVSNAQRIYDFKNWQLGGMDTLAANGSIILESLNEQSPEAQVESLVTLGKMYLSNGQGQEALGFFRYAQLLLPDLEENPQFLALRGAARGLSWKSELAFADLSTSLLEPFEEIAFWKAYVLADLGDWEQATSILPPSQDVLYTYPPPIFNRVALVIAEINLRAGNIEGAEDLLEQVGLNEATLFDPQKAAVAYLKGEAARQKGETDKTIELWEPLVTGEDDMYRAKAGLALTRLLVNEKKLSSEDAIDRLERLRYAWRGDQLEAQIYYWLGKTYFEAADYVKGLNIMREAAAVSAGTQLGARIAAEMSDIFSNLFLSDELNKVSPMDSAALYEQFAELVPIGPQGDKVVEMLAEHMVQADLLERAADLLSHQLNHRLTGSEVHRVGVRLAAIYLLDGRPQEAMKALSKATASLQEMPEEQQTQDKFTEISLLRARALSQQKRPDQALALLNDLQREPNVNRLRADIAWSAGYWDDAAEAMEDVIVDENISLTRPLDDEYAALILNRAVALNLASDRIALANMREKYSDAMAQTDKAREFEVISRPRQSAALADRETLMGIVSEVDLFGDFMNSYRSSNAPSN